MEKVFDHVLPIKTVSESNCTEHWMKKSKRHKLQKTQVGWALKCDKPTVKIPCLIKLIRLTARELDGDNLQMAFKWIRDAVADYIHPGLQAGRADDDKAIKWEYDQEKVSKICKIRIEIYNL